MIRSSITSTRKDSHPKTLPVTNPDSVTMRTLQPPLSWQLYIHLSSAASEAASDVDTDLVLSSFPEMENASEQIELISITLDGVFYENIFYIYFSGN